MCVKRRTYDDNNVLRQVWYNMLKRGKNDINVGIPSDGTSTTKGRTSPDRKSRISGVRNGPVMSNQLVYNERTFRKNQMTFLKKRLKQYQSPKRCPERYVPHPPNISVNRAEW